FTEIGRVKGAGTSTSTHYYELIDDSPVESNQMWNYYRLKQVDNDGKFTYSHVIAVQLKPGANIYPAISTGLFYYTAGIQDADITVYSSQGQKITHFTSLNPAGAF